MELGAVCGRIRRGSQAEREVVVLAELSNSSMTDRWEIEIIRAADGTLVDVMARARDPRHAFAGRVFTCDGELDPEAAAARASAYATQPPAPSASP